MKKNRFISLSFIIAAAVFASFFGGAFSYALFYASIAVPAACFSYVLFVYARLKVYQVIDSKTVVKGEKIGYKYILSNESRVYFTNIKAEFISDYSKVDLTDFQDEQRALAPGEKSENSTGLVCLYRGEYKVGVKSVTIGDYLGLFSLTRDYPSAMNVRVYPRVVKLQSLAALNFDGDVKSLPFTVRPGQEQDADLRSFEFGDSVRAVNWKVTAKRGELYTRRRIEPPKEKIVIFVDTAVIRDEKKKIPLEDRILESSLAIADFYRGRKIETEIVYPTAVLNRISINDDTDFQSFYDICLSLKFMRADTNEFLENLPLYGATALVLVTADAGRFIKALSAVSSRIKSCAVLTGNLEQRELSEIRQALGKTTLVHIPEDGDIEKLLS